MTRLKPFLSVAVVLASAHSAIAEECDGRLEVATTAQLPTYNPLALTSLRDRQEVRVRNTSDRTCTFKLAFARSPATGEFAEDLTYRVTDDNNRDLLSSAAIDDNRPTLISAPIAPMEYASLDYHLLVDRGQMARPKQYTDDIQVILLSENRQRKLDQYTLQLSIEVEAVSDVTLAGGGVLTSIQFGKLTEGASHSVILAVRSNTQYKLSLQSNNGGAMQLTPPVGNQEWRVQYDMKIDGMSRNFSEIIDLPHDTPSEGEAIHRLKFTITDATNKRAGVYKDFIAAKVVPLF